MNMEKNIRNQGLDLLKVIAMVMVITLHFLLYGINIKEIQVYSLGYNISWLLEAVCICAVNVYVLITGYFLADKEYKFIRVWKVWLKTAIIGSVIYLIFTLFRIEPLSLKKIIITVLPVMTNRYWFVSSYIIMMLATPFINLYIKNSNKRQFIWAIIALLFFNIIFDFAGSQVWTSNRGMSWIWFINLYMIAAYIKKYKNDIKGNKFLLYYIISVLLIYFSKLLMEYFTTIIFGEPLYTSLMYNYNSPLCLLAAINLFVFFKNIDCKSNKLVKYLSSSTLMVYIIHENEYLRNVIFGKLIISTNNILINFVQLLILIVIIYSFSTVINLTYEKIYKVISNNKTFINIPNILKCKYSNEVK